MKDVGVVVPVIFCLLLSAFSFHVLAVPLAGDVDVSGQVNAIDVQLVINGALGLQAPAASDVDYSGATNALDVQLVINAALGLGIDADGDGLPDAAESSIGTSANLFDTDGDGVGDGQEMLDGTNPLVAEGTEPPPDPTDVAPDLDLTVATDMKTATEFLYTGNNRIQTGVVPGTIEAKRVAVLRGKVTERDGDPLLGVRVTVQNRPEFGQTLTRENGLFDMAVNGGGVLTVRYEKEGYLGAQRQVTAPWQDYAWLPDVALVEMDPLVTTIDLNSGAPMQVARGSTMSDDDGARQAALFVPEGTTATLVLPDGSTEPISTLNVHLTEFTVGDNGLNAMPAELPANTAYTYCLEFSAEEAETAGAATVEFNEPIPFYVENFLELPIGVTVPVGYYDKGQAAWFPSANGLIIAIIDVQEGLAVLDVDGSGGSADAQALAELGVTDAERQQLGSLYTPGTSLWRIPVPHFTQPIDGNFPMSPPEDADYPGVDPETTKKLDNPVESYRCRLAGHSTIGAQNQTLGESVGVAGTPFSLHYASDRVPGRKTGYTLSIPLSEDTIPASVLRIDLDIRIAGRRFVESFPPGPNQQTTFTWDGKDAYGRTLQGAQPVEVRLSYVYDGLYQEPVDQENAFGNGGTGTSIGTARVELPLTVVWYDSVGTWDARAQGFGGWALSPHNAYDPIGRVLYLGTGGRRSAQSVSNAIQTVLGTGQSGSGGVGGPGQEAQVSRPRDVLVAPDGTIYVADMWNRRVLRMGTDGIVTVIAAPRTPRDLALGPDGSLYIAGGTDRVVFKWAPPDGLEVVAGTIGVEGNTGDGGPAVDALFKEIDGVAVAPDGSIYIADAADCRIRKITPDGIVRPFAGTGESGTDGDGGQARDAWLATPVDVSLGPDGCVYTVSFNGGRIRRIGTDGVITTLAGGGNKNAASGLVATGVNLYRPTDVKVGPDGLVYFISNSQVWRVDPDGVMTSVAGGGDPADGVGDGNPATAAALAGRFGFAFDFSPDGSLYICDENHNRIRHVSPVFPGMTYEDIVIAAEDGSELYYFDSAGTHQRTVDALTGAVLYTFTYDSENGLLTAVEDADGNITTVERDTDGTASALIAPFGQRTELTLNQDGYLSGITNPLGNTYTCTYADGGLLETFENPRGYASEFTYDDTGRLIKDEDATGGFVDLERTEGENSYTVTMTTAEGQVNSYQVKALDTGKMQLLNTLGCCGVQNTVLIGTDGTTRITYADGRVVTRVEGPDPRFGMQAPVTEELTVVTPAGLRYEATREQAATLADPSDPFSVETLTDTVVVNGRTYTSTFDGAENTIVTTSPEGRQTVTTVDAQARPLHIDTPGLETISYSYTDRGELEHAARGARVNTYLYDDGSGYLNSSTNPNQETISYVRDALGRILQLTFADTNTWSFTRDEMGNLTTLTEPDGTTIHSYTYTPFNLPDTYSSPLGYLQTFSYDKDRRLTRRQSPSGRAVEWLYNAEGQLGALRTPEGDHTFAYDASSGLLIQSLSRDGQQVDYSYDGHLLTGAYWTNLVTGSIGYSYNNKFLLSQLEYGAVSLPIAYDGDGQLSSVGSVTITRDDESRLITGLSDGEFQVAYGRNTYGEIDSVMVTQASTLWQVAYSHDDLGRISQKVETAGGNTHTWEYQYDTIGQLASVERGGVTVEYYEYDSVGNRIGLYNAFTGKDLASADYDYDADNKLLAAGGVSYTYDGDGRLYEVVDGGSVTRYHYNSDGTLRAVDLADGRVVTYSYDALGRRIVRAVDGVRTHAWLYSEGLMPVAEYDGTGTLRTTFIHAVSSTPVAMVRGGVTYHIVVDQLGSPRLVVDPSGNIVKQVDYDSFGNIITDTNAAFDLPFGFAGGICDPDHELIRYGVRDYQPSTGRWTSKDPILLFGGRNLYTYVENDPVTFKDPSGLVRKTGTVTASVSTHSNVVVSFLAAAVGMKHAITATVGRLGQDASGQDIYSLSISGAGGSEISFDGEYKDFGAKIESGSTTSGKVALSGYTYAQMEMIFDVVLSQGDVLGKEKAKELWEKLQHEMGLLRRINDAAECANEVLAGKVKKSMCMQKRTGVDN